MQDEIELEVFRADTKASRGISSADLAHVAAFDCEKNPVACVVGHPKSDSPAEAVVKGFRAEGNKLFATVSNWSDKLVDGIRNKRLLNRSMAFFAPDHPANPTPGKYAPRHLGFLGASAPGIPGMSNLAEAFSFNAEDDLVIEDDPAEAIVFEAAPTKVRRIQEEPKGMDDKEFEAERDRLAAEDKRLKDERAEFEAERETSRKAANKSRVDQLVTAGRILPADREALETVFNALSGDELEFSATDKGLAADKLASILGKGPRVVNVDGKPLSPTGDKTFAASGDGKSDANQITAAARALMDEDKSLTFEAAVERVTEGAN